MLITTYIPKGGQGKTSLSYNLSIDLGKWYYFSNDTLNSIVSSIYDNSIDEIEKKHYVENNLMFDGGGFLDSKLKNVLKGSDIILVPFEINDPNVYNSLFNLINELKLLNIDLNNVVFVCNKLTKVDFKIYKDFKELLINEENIKKENITYLRFSKLFRNSFKEKKSILELINSSTNKKLYNNILEEYTFLIDIINKKLKIKSH